MIARVFGRQGGEPHGLSEEFRKRLSRGRWDAVLLRQSSFGGAHVLMFPNSRAFRSMFERN